MRSGKGGARAVSLVPEMLLEITNRRQPDPRGISVIVSLYNYERFIVECLDSVWRQSYPFIELIVVDDCSQQDGSVLCAQTWLGKHASRFDRVALVQHKINRGLAATRNTGFEVVRTELVFVLDADNELYPRALCRLYEAVITSPAYAAYSQIELFGEQKGIGQADVWNRDRMRLGNYVDAMALISVQAWQEVGGYDHIDGGWEDFDFWCKMIEKGITAVFVAEVLCRYRVHKLSMLRTFTDVATSQLKIDMVLRHPWLELTPDLL